MNKKTVGIVIAMVCYSAAVAAAFYFIGYKAAYGSMEYFEQTSFPQTFYATISDIEGDRLTVMGMEVNDINFRGEFCFSVTEGTKILWRYTDIFMEDLDVGDSISITFTGEILETSPSQIQGVHVIQLLEDEK